MSNKNKILLKKIISGVGNANNNKDKKYVDISWLLTYMERFKSWENNGVVYVPELMRSMTKRDILVDAIKCDPTFAELYNDLACNIKEDEKVEVFGLGKVGRKELYLKAIESNPTFAKAYYNLANSIKSDEKIEVSGLGKRGGRKELYLKAIEINPRYVSAYYNLTCNLKSDERIEVPRLGKVGRKELLSHVIKLNPQFVKAYYNLACEMRFGERVKVEGLGDASIQTVCAKAIELSPDSYLLYDLLLWNLNKEDGIKISNVYKSVKQLCLDVIHLKTEECRTHIYWKLSACLKKGETVTLPHLGEVTRFQLFCVATLIGMNVKLKDIELEPTGQSSFSVWNHLGLAMRVTGRYGNVSSLINLAMDSYGN